MLQENEDKIQALLEENIKLKKNIRSLVEINSKIIMCTDIFTTLFKKRDIEEISNFLISQIIKNFDAKEVTFIRKESKKDMYCLYSYYNGKINRKIISRSELNCDCFFMYCKNIHLGNSDNPFVALPIKLNGENLGGLIAKKINTRKFKNINFEMINAYLTAFGIAIKNSLLSLELQNDKQVLYNYKMKIDEDLDFACKIQNAILPIGENKFYNYNLYGNLIQTRYLGGDMFDVIFIDASTIAFYIADVSGSGISASLVTLFLKGAVEEIVQYVILNKIKISPSIILKKIQKRFSDFIFTDNLYIGLIMGVLDVDSNIITLANAGHNVEPIHIKDGSNKALNYMIGGLPINNWFSYDIPIKYDEIKINMDEGDNIILLTDGAIEVRNSEKNIFGMDTLNQIFINKKSDTFENQFRYLQQRLHSFTGDSKLDSTER